MKPLDALKKRWQRKRDVKSVERASKQVAACALDFAGLQALTFAEDREREIIAMSPHELFPKPIMVEPRNASLSVLHASCIILREVVRRTGDECFPGWKSVKGDPQLVLEQAAMAFASIAPLNSGNVQERWCYTLLEVALYVAEHTHEAFEVLEPEPGMLQVKPKQRLSVAR